MTKVLSVGGSIVAPANPDTDFLQKFSKMIRTWLDEDKNRKLILVVGGGGPARIYQGAYKEITPVASNAEADCREFGKATRCRFFGT